MTPLLQADLERDEGFASTAYADPISHGVPWTIGFGHTSGVREGETCSRDQAVEWLNADIAVAAKDLDHFLPWWRGTLSDVRQDALVNMTFNIGIGSLLGFHHFLGFLQEGKWQWASSAMLASTWATQVGDRAKRLAFMIANGARET